MATSGKPKPSTKHVVLVLDTSALSLQEVEQRKQMIRTMLESFEKKHVSAGVSLTYALILYGSAAAPNSVQCLERVKCLKDLVSWIDLVEWEGSVRHSSALTQALYQALLYNVNIPPADSYIVVATCSEPSGVSILVEGNKTVKLSAMVKVIAPRAKVSLLCTARIESLKNVWMTDIGMQEGVILRESTDKDQEPFLQILNDMPEPLSNIKHTSLSVAAGEGRTILWGGEMGDTHLNVRVIPTISSPSYRERGPSILADWMTELKICRLFPQNPFKSQSHALVPVEFHSAPGDRTDYNTLTQRLQTQFALIKVRAETIHNFYYLILSGSSGSLTGEFLQGSRTRDAST